MQTKQFTYHNLGYWFLLFIVLSFAGFYHTYFTKLLDIKTPIIHIHFLLMGLWISMLIVQPFLIKYKKLALILITRIPIPSALPRLPFLFPPPPFPLGRLCVCEQIFWA